MYSVHIHCSKFGFLIIQCIYICSEFLDKKFSASLTNYHQLFLQLLNQIWPFIGDYVRNLLIETIQPKIQQSHSSVSGFKFTHIDLGDIVSQDHV